MPAAVAPRVVETETLRRELSVVPGSYDADAHTVDLVVSSERVMRFRGWAGSWREYLSHEDGAIDTERVAKGQMPLLLEHGRANLTYPTIGIVTAFEVVDRKMRLRVRFSQRAEVQPIESDVANGVLHGASLGYNVLKLVDETPRGKDGEMEKEPLYRAARWEPIEVSLTGTPRNIDAHVASADLHHPPVRTIVEDQASTVAGEEPAPSEVVPMPEKTPETVSAEEAKRLAAEAVAQERKRAASIRAVCTKHKLPAEFADSLIAREDLDIDGAREAVLDELHRLSTRQATPPGTATVEVTEDARDKWREAAVEAMQYRCGAIDAGKLTSAGKEARKHTLSLIDLARECIRKAGMIVPDDKHSIAGVALNLVPGKPDRTATGGSLGTSDLPQIVADVANKAALRGYQAAPAKYRLIARRSTASDFKPMRRVRLADGTQMTPLTEHAEFAQGKITDEAETYALETFGRWFAFTRQLIVNDDLSLLDRIPAAFGRQALRREEIEAWQIFSQNSGLGEVMGDGTALFDASHGNLAATAGAPSIATLNSMMLALANQTDADGNRIDLTLAYVIVPASLAATAYQFWTQITPEQGGNVNPFAPGGQLALRGVIWTAHLPATIWYGSCHPDEADVLEYAHLDGMEGPSVETQVDIRYDGMLMRGRFDFGVKAMDWRSLVRNAGA